MTQQPWKKSAWCLLKVLLSFGGWWMLFQAQAQAQPSLDGIPPLTRTSSELKPSLLNLQTEASLELPQDTLTIHLQARVGGQDPAQIQQILTRTMAQALAQAKPAEQASGLLELHVSRLEVQPDQGGHPDEITTKTKKEGLQWVGLAQLTIKGSDLVGVAALAAKLNMLHVEGLFYSLSTAARQAAVLRLSEEALDRFREQATHYAKRLGFQKIRIRELTVQDSFFPAPHRGMSAMPLLRSTTMGGSMGDNTIAVQAGHETVRVHVNGAVELLP